MSTKFSRASNQNIQIPDKVALTFPRDVAWTQGFIVVFDGITSGDFTQYFVSTGAFQSSGSYNIIYYPVGGSVYPGQVAVYCDIGAATAPLTKTTATFSSGAYLFVIQHAADNSMSMRHCPILSTQPTTGSAVVTSASLGGAGVLDGTGLFIGGRVDSNADRAADQSMARVFYMSGVLTDLEVANLAYGKELGDIGKTPNWYFRMDTPTDLTDRGTQGNVATANSTLATGTSPGFGYVATATAPTITSAPTISGAVVGSPSTVTRGAYTGTPTPTPTYQWKIDGTAVSGATGTSYTPVAGDSGKTLTVTQTETNGTSPAATSTSSGVVVAASAPASVTATELTAERIYQRISGSAVVALSGTWTGATQPTTIEYQLYAPDGTTVQKVWATAGATIAAGNTWTASPSIPQPTNGKKYLIQYRSKDSSGTVLATSAIKSNRFGVGDIHGFLGSSSAEKAFYTDSGTGFTLDPDVTSRYDGTWYTIGTGCAIQIASSLAVQAGVPVALFDYGIGGSTMANWVTTYAGWTDFANGVAANGGKLAGVLFTAGSNDASGGLVTSRASHLANLRTFVARCRSLTSQTTLPVCIIGFNRRTSFDTNAAQYALCADYVRMAENDVGDDTGVCSIQTLDFLLSSDGIHLASVDTGFPAWGRRISYQFGAFLNGTYLRGPKQTQIVASGVTTTHTLVHRGSTDFTPTSSITGFTATDSSGVAISLVSSVRTNATTITNTWASAPTKVQYLEGGAPAVGTPVFGNTTSPLPMTVETDMAIASALATAANFTVVDSTGAAVTGLTGLDYAFYDNYRISAGQAPVKYGTTLAISGGTATIDLTGVTTLAPGGIGRVIWSDAAGTKIGSGLVTVS